MCLRKAGERKLCKKPIDCDLADREPAGNIAEYGRREGVAAAGANGREPLEFVVKGAYYRRVGKRKDRGVSSAANRAGANKRRAALLSGTLNVTFKAPDPKLILPVIAGLTAGGPAVHIERIRSGSE